MTNELKKSVAGLGIAVTLLYLSGCTAIGYRIGSAIDKGARHVPEQEWLDARPGRKVLVHCTNDTLIAGVFDGSGYMSLSEYDERFRNWTAADTAGRKLPTPGNPLVLNLTSGEQVNGELFGYDRRQDPSVQRKVGSMQGDRTSKAGRGQVGVVMVKRASTAKTARFDTKLLKSLNGDSALTVSFDRLHELIVKENIPTVSTIIVKSNTQRWTIPLDDISRIDYDRRGAARWIGMGIGFAIDAGIGAIVVFIAHGGIGGN